MHVMHMSTLYDSSRQVRETSTSYVALHCSLTSDLFVLNGFNYDKAANYCSTQLIRHVLAAVFFVDTHTVYKYN